MAGLNPTEGLSRVWGAADRFCYRWLGAFSIALLGCYSQPVGAGALQFLYAIRVIHLYNFGRTNCFYAGSAMRRHRGSCKEEAFWSAQSKGGPFPCIVGDTRIDVFYHRFSVRARRISRMPGGPVGCARVVCDWASVCMLARRPQQQCCAARSDETA